MLFGSLVHGRSHVGRRLRARDAPVAVLVLIAVGLAAPGQAFAHAAFVESAPEPGARLAKPPSELRLRFTEPLVRELVRVEVVDAASGRRVATATSFTGRREVVVRPARTLGKAPYRVTWHTVSTFDGHALEGTFGFGVQAAALGGQTVLERSPFARHGWIRVAARTLFYIALFFFAGGILVSAILSRGRPAGAWLFPASMVAEPSGRALSSDDRLTRAFSRTRQAGWIAAGAAAAVSLVEAVDAAGGFDLDGASSFLVANNAGFARVATVFYLVIAVLLMRRYLAWAGVAVATALLCVAFGGHANSASPRGLSLAADWLHLLAGSVWIGGIFQIALAWAPAAVRNSRPAARAAIGDVLPAFGRVAIPAFGVMVTAGAVSAVVQLGRVEALWDSAYGRVLMLKIAFVGLIAVASYVHAYRLRPRLMEAADQSNGDIERRHWRLIRIEPVLAALAIAAAAVLVVSPLPPRQLEETAEAVAGGAEVCNPCPQRLPMAGEIAVAARAGTQNVAAWLSRKEGQLLGELHLLGGGLRPSRARFEIFDARATSCGTGCSRFTMPAATREIVVRVADAGRDYTVRLPAQWVEGRSKRARQLIARAQEAMRALRSVREHEVVTSGPGPQAVTRYSVRAPDRFTFRTNGGVETIVIDRRQWLRKTGQVWRRQEYGGGLSFRSRRWFRWTPFSRAARLLRVERAGGRELAEIALMDEATPVWMRLKIDLATFRVSEVRAITANHSMTQRFFAFNRRLEIRAPRKDDVD